MFVVVGSFCLTINIKTWILFSQSKELQKRKILNLKLHIFVFDFVDISVTDLMTPLIYSPESRCPHTLLSRCSASSPQFSLEMIDG